MRKKRSDKRWQKEIARQIAKRSGPKLVSSKRWATLWLAPFVLILVIIGINYLPSQSAKLEANDMQSVVSDVSNNPIAPLASKVDKVVETGLVADLAKTANLPIALSAANLATSAEIQASSTQKASPVIDKPELVSLSGNRQEVVTHLVADGETIDQLASRYDISAQTIRWANNLTGDAIEVGKELKILPVDGVHYKVKAGDNYEKIVARYGSSETQIVAFNDLELTNLVADSMIVIPGGELPETERPGYKPPKPVYNPTQSQNPLFRPSNGMGVKYYPWGWCTWYAAYRFPQLNGGKEIGNWGNANTWDNSAYGTPGFSVSSTPSAGAIFQTDFGSTRGLGHVGIVESVEYNEDGSIASIRVSDMNGFSGWGQVGYGTWTADKFSKYKYIK